MIHCEPPTVNQSRNSSGSLQGRSVRRCCHDTNDPWNEAMPRALMVRPQRVMPLMNAASKAEHVAATTPSWLPGPLSAISCNALAAEPVPLISAYIIASALSRQKVSTARAKVSSSIVVAVMSASSSWIFPASSPPVRGRSFPPDRTMSTQDAWPGPLLVGSVVRSPMRG